MHLEIISSRYSEQLFFPPNLKHSPPPPLQYPYKTEKNLKILEIRLFVVSGVIQRIEGKKNHKNIRVTTGTFFFLSFFKYNFSNNKDIEKIFKQILPRSEKQIFFIS